MTHGTTAMKAVNIDLLVDRNYALSHDFQWGREATMNAFQNGASRIHYMTEWQTVKKRRIYRRLILDDGPGIPRELMSERLNEFGGSGQTVAAAGENFGIGLKTSLYPWNTYGIVFISRTVNPDNPKKPIETMMMLHKDPTTGLYGARRFDVQHKDGNARDQIFFEEWDDFYIEEDREKHGDNGTDWTKVFPKNQPSGLAIILLGDHPDQDTVQNDPGKNEDDKYGTTKYSNARFWNMPIEIKADQYEVKGDKANWPTAPTKVGGFKQARLAIGLERNIDQVLGTPTKTYPNRGKQADGVFTVRETSEYPGFKYTWVLGKEPGLVRGDTVNFPISGLLHTSHTGLTEVYDFAGGGMGTKAANLRMSRFIKAKPVRERVAILIEPLPSKNFDIYPESSRTALKFEPKKGGAQEIPWDYVIQQWLSHIPEEINDAINAFYAEHTSARGTLTDDMLRRLENTYGDRLATIAMPVGTSSNGDVFGRPVRNAGPATSNGSKKKSSTTDRSGGSSSGDNVTAIDSLRTRRVGLGVIRCVEVSDKDPENAVEYDETAGVVSLHTLHPVYLRVLNDLTNAVCDKKSINEQDARYGVVQGVYREKMAQHMSMTVTQALTLSAKETDGETARSMVSPVALQTALFGIIHFELMAGPSIASALRVDRNATSEAV